MELTKPNKIQILNEDLEVSKEAAEMINKLNIDKNGKDRMLISIIGATGSGKSSIWNRLFNCDFEEKTAGQTSRVTVGGWLYYWKEHNIEY